MEGRDTKPVSSIGRTGSPALPSPYFFSPFSGSPQLFALGEGLSQVRLNALLSPHLFPSYLLSTLSDDSSSSLPHSSKIPILNRPMAGAAVVY